MKRSLCVLKNEGFRGDILKKQQTQDKVFSLTNIIVKFLSYSAIIHYLNFLIITKHKSPFQKSRKGLLSYAANLAAILAFFTFSSAIGRGRSDSRLAR